METKNEVAGKAEGAELVIARYVEKLFGGDEQLKGIIRDHCQKARLLEKINRRLVACDEAFLAGLNEFLAVASEGGAFKEVAA